MKPSLKRFEEVSNHCEGNISAIAATFKVYRTTVYDWMKKDPAFSVIVEHHRGRFLDECLAAAKNLACGIPKYDQTGNFIGWKVRPDGLLLRYLIGKLGASEGFGESIDITSKGQSITPPESITIEVIDRREQVENRNGTN